MLAAIIITITISILVSILWVSGITNMKKSHPNYTGEDFLNWDVEKNTAGRDGWDDNIVHTEGEI
jgi:hypothetical protein